ncbi:ComEC/Rec2 family competence protein [Pontibacter sp. G13]|uniref:ComEC/Rec2 family competence protein n=1 Tax=Pontibacter sp. G13 TaxID=3074898 RepID=UPI00288C211F|nr:ComEC/Rec2 family competence protein [Pontibacter sp. G13]WNJ17424.1 ComEC/Rec2 family competence protein [Pontibacter sp. G13]
MEKHTQHPLVWLAGSLVVGMICARGESWIWGLSSLVFWGMLVAFLVLDGRRFGQYHEWTFATCAVLAGMVFGGWIKLSHDESQAPTSLQSLHCETVHCSGHIIKSIRPTQYGYAGWAEMDGRIEAGCQYVIRNRMVLYFDSGQAPDLSQTQRVFLTGKLKPVDPTTSGYAEYLASQGVTHTLQVKHWESAGWEMSLSARWQRFRQRYLDRLSTQFPHGKTFGLAAAMSLGDKEHLAKDAKGAFARVGLSHALAISGLHVGIVFLVLNALLGGLVYFPHGHQWKYALVLGILVGYMCLTGASPAVVRSVLMFGTGLLFRIFRLRFKVLNIVASSAIWQMVIDPHILFELGFQLSYAAVVGIVVGFPWLSQWMRTGIKWLDPALDALSISLLATLATLPWVWIYFGQFPVYFLPANLLGTVWIFLTVAIGFLWVMLGAIPYVGEWIAWTYHGMLEGLLWGIDLIGRLPYSLLQEGQPWQKPLGMIGLQLMVIALIAGLPRIIRWWLEYRKRLAIQRAIRPAFPQN